MVINVIKLPIEKTYSLNEISSYNKLMRIPIFEEIEVKKFDLNSLNKFFVNKKLRRGPHYIDLTKLSSAFVVEAMDNIAIALEKLNIHPEFPFPFYIITEACSSHKVLQVSKSVDDLPAHFVRRVKRLKNKELAVLNKTLLLAEKLSNQEVKEIINDLKSCYGPQKELYQNCREINFYQHILDQIN
jgi:hypothetical protein